MIKNKDIINVIFCFFLSFFISCDSSIQPKKYQVEKKESSIIGAIMPMKMGSSNALFIKLNIDSESIILDDLSKEFNTFCSSFIDDESSNEEFSFNLNTSWDNPIDNNSFSLYNYQVLVDNGNATLSISKLPFNGDIVPFIESNVNRWRNQINLNPLTYHEIEKEMLEGEAELGIFYWFIIKK